MRERYETKADLKAELAIVTAWASTYGGDPFKLPDGPRYSVDFAILSGRKVVAMCEIKDRKKWKEEYGNIILGLSKVRELMTYHLMGIPSYFVVRVHGDIIFTRIDERINDYDMGIHGRWDRDDKDDREPCYRIPLGSFTKCHFQGR